MIDGPSGFISDPLVQLVEQGGPEPWVTLVIGGTVLCGAIMPMRRYLDWSREVTARAMRAGGHFHGTGDLPDPTAAQLERTSEAWLRDHGEDERVSFRWFALRNATIVSAAREVRLPAMVVDAAAVAAMSPGVPSGDWGP